MVGVRGGERGVYTPVVAETGPQGRHGRSERGGERGVYTPVVAGTGPQGRHGQGERGGGKGGRGVVTHLL